MAGKECGFMDTLRNDEVRDQGFHILPLADLYMDLYKKFISFKGLSA